MTYTVEISDLAQSDITTIVRYIRLELLEPGTAQHMYQKLRSAIENLDQMSERYPLFDEPRCCELRLHKMLVKKYLVLYRVDRKQKLVQVARVIYAGRDISRQLIP